MRKKSKNSPKPFKITFGPQFAWQNCQNMILYKKWSLAHLGESGKQRKVHEYYREIDPGRARSSWSSLSPRLCSSERSPEVYPWHHRAASAGTTVGKDGSSIPKRRRYTVPNSRTRHHAVCGMLCSGRLANSPSSGESRFRYHQAGTEACCRDSFAWRRCPTRCTGCREGGAGGTFRYCLQLGTTRCTMETSFLCATGFLFILFTSTIIFSWLMI